MWAALCSGRNFHEEKCACGKVATKMDPHNDGDCPLELCDECYRAEDERLRAQEEKMSHAT